MTRCAITSLQAGGSNLCAFLDMISWSEGTDKPGQKTTNRGYDVLVGGGNFVGYADHPRQSIFLPKLRLNSTAAGRYQHLSKYFDAYRVTLKLPDFSPLSQDRIALQQIRERRAIPMLLSGDFGAAVQACSNIWASLPGAGYGQHEHELSALASAYRAAGGVVA